MRALPMQKTAYCTIFPIRDATTDDPPTAASIPACDRAPGPCADDPAARAARRRARVRAPARSASGEARLLGRRRARALPPRPGAEARDPAPSRRPPPAPRAIRSPRWRARSSASRSRSRPRRRYGSGWWSPPPPPARRRGCLDPARVGRTRLPTLRRCGLSERKATYVRDLARHFVTGALDPAEWPAPLRRGADRTARRRQRNRPLDGRDVPDLP